MLAFTEPPISFKRIEYLRGQGIPKPIAEINLEMVKSKMREPVKTGGLHWQHEWCEIAEVEYKRFLTLRLLWPKQTIVPTRFIDMIWHYHILDTRAYRADCKRVFGAFLHHNPYLGGSGGTRAAENTRRLYQQTFGESIMRNLVPTEDEESGRRRIG